MTKYYLVVYYDNGKDKTGNQITTIHCWPGESKEDCEKTLHNIMDSKFGKKIRYHDIIESSAILQVKREIVVENKPVQKKQKYSKLSKSELKEILKERGIKTLYHDTLDILIQKCINSEQEWEVKK